MRSYLSAAFTIALVMPGMSSARANDIPNLDVRPVCRGIAGQSADPGVGQGGQAETYTLSGE
jgi:hypothetical protein